MAQLPADVSNSLIPHYQREYADLCTNWQSLERKAQVAGGVAGALLSGLVTLFGHERFDVSRALEFFFPLIGILLFVSASYAFAALRVSDETVPVPGEKLRARALELERLDHADWSERFHQEAAHMQVVFWDQACRDLHRSCTTKGTRVAVASAWLLAAGGAALLLVLLQFVAS